MAFKTHAMSIFTTLYLCVLLIHLTNGQCRTDCPCVPPQPAPGGENRCCLSIRENLPSGSLVGNANDLALIADFMPVVYEFTPVDEAGTLLNLNRTTGAITIVASIDRETFDCLEFVVRVRDAGDVPLATPGRFRVVIEDENDNRPQFQPSVSILNITVEENNAPNTLNCENQITELVNLHATDRDTGSNAEVTYKVAEGHGSVLFTVSNPQRPCVDNLVPLDRENTSILYSFILVAMDGGNPRMSSNITVIFTLEDVNDNAPVFPNTTVNISVFENATIGSVVYQFQATDLDLETQPLRYNLMYSNPIPFQINQETGKLNLIRALNIDTTDKYHFTVLANDSNSVHTTMLSATVTVIDVNEPAVVNSPNIPAELVEEVLADAFVISVTDTDKSTANTMNVIRFISGGEYFRQVEDIIKIGNQQIFRIGQYTPIDRENVTNGIVQLSVIIEQMGNPPLEERFQHNFTILDINDNEPYLITTQFNITEDSDTQGQSTSTPVRRIQLKNFVRDDDAGENGAITSFSLISVKSIKGDFTEDFRISNALGVDQEIHDGNLLLPRPLDREDFGEALRVTMNFTDGGTPPLSRVDAFTIKIIDVNDNSPEFESSQYIFNLTENRSLDFIIGSVKATDADDPIDNGRVVYSLDETRGDYEAFTVDQINGTIRNRRVFDRETKANYTFYISASESGSPPRRANESAKVIVVILDVNDEPPAFETNKYTFNVINGANVGDFVGMVAAIDPDEDPAENQITYKFLVPTPYFSIDNSTGNIILIKALSIQDSPYNLTVVACNPGFEHLRGAASITVVVDESSLSAAIIGGVSGGAAFILIMAIIVLCCCIVCVCHKSRTSGKLEVDGNGALNNQKPILKTLPATNGQQRSVKFSTTVEETHYDPSGIGEHSVIRKESNIVSGDDSPQTSLRTTVPNGAMSTNSPEIVDYDMSPNLGINGNIPSHHRPQYPRHGKTSSPIMFQEELNPSEFSQSEDEEAESTFSNFNPSISCFGRQTVQIEECHHPADFSQYVTPPTHPPHKSRMSGKLEVDGNGALNNPKPILKTLPATNGQQRSVKFSKTVKETHYNPSGIEEHSVIHKESNIVSRDDSLQISLQTTVPNGAMSANSPEIVDYDMSPNLTINGDSPSHHRPQYPHHGRTSSPIMLQEELNPSEFSQSTGSVVDDRNTYNLEGEEVESTYSDAPSNFNTSIPRARFGRQTVQVEGHHHPANFGRYAPPPAHPPLNIHHDLHSHLPPVHHLHGQHSSPGHLAELRADNLAALNAQYASSSHPPGVPPAEDIRDLSLNSLPRNIGHHGSIGSSRTSIPPQRLIHRPLPPPSICQPPLVSIPHSIITQAPSNGHTKSRNYPHPLVMAEAFPSRPPSDIHRFDSFIPPFTDYGETSTCASTELNEALKFKYEAEPDVCSLTVTDYGEDIHRNTMLQEELNSSEFSQSTGSMVDDRNTYNSEGEEEESSFSDVPSTSVPHFGRQTIQNHLPTLDIHHDIHSYGQHSSPGHLAELRAHTLEVLPETFPSNVVNYNMSTNLGTNSIITQESNSSRGAQSLQTCSDTSTAHSDPIFGNLPCSHTQISAATYTSSEGSSTDYAHLMLQANITYTNYDK